MTHSEIKSKPFVQYPDGSKGRVVSFNDSGFTVMLTSGMNCVHDWDDACLFRDLPKKGII